jgi:hypothetical protein
VRYYNGRVPYCICSKNGGSTNGIMKTSDKREATGGGQEEGRGAPKKKSHERQKK